MIMAGGKGERLHPLTRERSKPSVPFGGRYRHHRFRADQLRQLRDAGRSTCSCSTSRSRSSSTCAWPGAPRGILPDYFVTVVPPQMRFGAGLVPRHRRRRAPEPEPDRRLQRRRRGHLRRRSHLSDGHESDARPSIRRRAPTSRSPRARCRWRRPRSSACWRSTAGRVVGLRREAGAAQGRMPGDPERALVSMGNYFFSRRRWSTRCWPTPAARTDHDFGRSIIPEMVPTGRVFAYDFQDNEVPGVKPYEEQGYWRDVGTVAGVLGRPHGPARRIAALRPRQPALADPHGPASRPGRPLHRGRRRQRPRRRSLAGQARDHPQLDPRPVACGSTRARSSRTRSSWTTPRSARAPACGAPSSIASTSSRPTARSAWTRPSTGGGTTSTLRGSSSCPRGGRREFLLGLEEF